MLIEYALITDLQVTKVPRLMVSYDTPRWSCEASSCKMTPDESNGRKGDLCLETIGEWQCDAGC